VRTARVRADSLAAATCTDMMRPDFTRIIFAQAQVRLADLCA
jgi:hypothetical protein